MLNFIEKSNFETGFKKLEEPTTYYRFELSNGESVLEGFSITDKAAARSVTENTGFSYLIRCICDHYADEDVPATLYEVTATQIKDDWEEEFWKYCIIESKKPIMTLSYDELEYLAFKDFGTIEEMKTLLKELQ